MTIIWDEHLFVTSTIMPFLREHWELIDRPEQNNSECDGRLTKDELISSYEQALQEKRLVDAFILNELLIRYEPICRAHNDGYWFKDETVLGISEDDISVYEQMVNPEFRRSELLRPKPWF